MFTEYGPQKENPVNSPRIFTHEPNDAAELLQPGGARNTQTTSWEFTVAANSTYNA